MLDHAQQDARTRGKAFLRLDTALDLPKLRALYEDAGFQFVRVALAERSSAACYELPLS